MAFCHDPLKMSFSGATRNEVEARDPGTPSKKDKKKKS